MREHDVRFIKPWNITKCFVCGDVFIHVNTLMQEVILLFFLVTSGGHDAAKIEPYATMSDCETFAKQLRIEIEKVSKTGAYSINCRKVEFTLLPVQVKT